MKYKIIFLDIDGVLNDYNFISRNYELISGQQLFIDLEKVKILKEIIERTDAKIVLSSSWRNDFGDDLTPLSNGAEQILSTFQIYNLHIWDKTEDGCRKDQSINQWLSKHKDIVEKFVEIDDDYLEVSPSAFVRCSFYAGLTARIADDVIHILQ